MTLWERVADELSRRVPAGGPCLLAVSGGTDSLALLDLLHRGRERHRHPLIVAHVHHGISPDADRAMELVRRESAARGLPCDVVHLRLGSGTGETRARIARRRALRRIASRHGAVAIILAHQADDQSETVLLRVLHGSGPVGLAAIAPRRGIWVRPLLGTTRAELAEYLASRGLVPWEDPSNRDLRHLRSWLRQEVLPRLRERIPAVDVRLRNLGHQAGRIRSVLNRLPGLVSDLELREEPGAISVAAAPLRGYRSDVRHAVLASLARRYGVPLGIRRIGAISRLLEGGDAGRIDVGRGLSVELSGGRVAFFRAEPEPEPEPLALSPGVSRMVGRVRFAVSESPAGESTRTSWGAWLSPGSYLARGWRAGDRIRPLGGTGSRAVSVLLREARIPPRERSAWPVVARADDATVIWVPGICRSDACLPEEGTGSLHVTCAPA